MTKFKLDGFQNATNVWWHRNEAGIIVRCTEPSRITETTISEAIAKLEQEEESVVGEGIFEARERWEPNLDGGQMCKVGKVVASYPPQDESPTSALVLAEKVASEVLGEEDWRWAAGKNPKSFRAGPSGKLTPFAEEEKVQFINRPRLVKGSGGEVTDVDRVVEEGTV